MNLCTRHRSTGDLTHLDGSDGEGDLPPAIDVRVENTEDVLELLRNDQRLKTQNQKHFSWG